MPSAAQTYASAIRPLLRPGPAKAQALAQALQVSQPTVSRALGALGDDVVPFGAARSIQYTLRDPLRTDLEATVYRVTPQGALETLGALVPVCPQGFVMVEAGGARLHSDGLPWWIFDMRPQGYLGRAYCQRHGQRLGLPERLGDWSDTHALRAILDQGDDMPGNLLIGPTARDQFVNAPDPVPIAAAQKLHSYAQLADLAARGEVAGSSAAGEQPKFTAYAEQADGTAAHVMVKFTAELDTPVSARWRDLLLAEHIALQVLQGHGVPAARSMTWTHGTQRFLEVQRFDRLGARGRRALHSFAALDAEFVGSGGNWPVIAKALWKEGVITPQAFDTACLLWAFGTLIGNTDMHSGNLSCLSEGRRPYELAPAYDMTPMAFAPTAGGGLPDRALELTVGEQVSAAAWKEALAMAQVFVRRVEGEDEFSSGFEACKAELVRHVTVAAERIGRLVL
ncbi:type II toxin-antitoxin system HipA family toxin YjjJ [Acidovorax radicis]|uniref:type II toxin-antitoxin system HipA family toxin YjjJ n=1 Tax=Acidovorax radicis TaxID=758826 RepID=UPI001CF92147|nr:type II toxin-antitoxin system HipA family toxin YjjJ [Acidovorax radicis]UCU97603.1 type II toxin-antitoxin system HipA family toxin YjjJ [Acidovorax radicis]